MTISTTTSRQSYNGNGVTTVFAVPFRFFQNSDLVVQLITVSTGATSTLTLTTHYTVTGADEEAGGSLTMLTAPAVGQTLVIRRVIAATQEVDYISGEPFPAETHERALDRLTMLAQQGQEQQSRYLTLPATDSVNAELPPVALRANRYLAFNTLGEPVAVSGTSSDVVVTPFAQGLLDDTTADAAQTTLGGTTVGKAVFTAADETAARSAIGAAAAATSVPTTRTITVGGLATGGGDLSANRTITVTASSQAEAEAGVNTTTAMTPQRTAQALTAQLPAASAALAAGSVGTYAFCQQVSGTAVIGDTVAGSNLRYTDRSGGTNTVTIPTGTWRCMGNNSVADRGTVWLRIA